MSRPDWSLDFGRPENLCLVKPETKFGLPLKPPDWVEEEVEARIRQVKRERPLMAPGPRNSVSPRERQRIRELLQAGWNAREIGELCRRSFSSIEHLIKYHSLSRGIHRRGRT